MIRDLTDDQIRQWQAAIADRGDGREFASRDDMILWRCLEDELRHRNAR